MNPYLPTIIKKDMHFDVAVYSINRQAHEETFAASYTDKDTKTTGTVSFFKKTALHTNIMEILDYDTSDKESSLTAFSKLEDPLSLLGIGCPFDEKTFSQFLIRQSENDIVTIAQEVMPIIRSCFETHPALSYLYPLYYQVMHSCYLLSGRPADKELLQTAALLSEEVGSLKDVYAQARIYLTDVAIEPNAQGVKLPSSAIAEIYHSYCLYAQKPDFLSDSLSVSELKTSFLRQNNLSHQDDSLQQDGSLLQDDFSQQNDSLEQNWMEYLNHASAFVSENEICRYPITSFKQFVSLGIQQLLQDELVIKKCKLCNGYFRVKYSSNQEYCTRIYRDTSATCNEYASRKSYKERLFSHPIHTEFTKAYNRLYARIRRGKLPADTPLMEQLKALHDEYTENYENTHQKNREMVWKEYIEKNKELLNK